MSVDLADRVAGLEARIAYLEGLVLRLADQPSQRLPAAIAEPAPTIESEFAAFWGCYPRKIGKGQALKAYRAARKKVDAETIATGLARYCAECRARNEPQFVCHAATWLNGERWTDEEVIDAEQHRPNRNQPGRADVLFAAGYLALTERRARNADCPDDGRWRRDVERAAGLDAAAD